VVTLLLKGTMEEDATSDAVASPRRRRRVALTVVTDSEIQTYRSCHQLHDFKYRQRLRPKIDAKSLSVGSIFHAGMRNGLNAGWDEVGRSIDDLDLRVNRQIGMATAGIDALVHEWAGKVIVHGKGVDYERLAVEVDETAAMVKWMLAHYFRSTRDDLTSLMLVETERAFEVPMRAAGGVRVGHLRYAGVRDAVLYDPTYNAIVLYEHKTSGADPRGTEKRVEMDTQTAGYLNTLREEHRHGAGLVMVDGTPVPADATLGRVVYNVLRKEMPRPPKVNKDGRVSTAACVTTTEMYELALADQVDRGIARSSEQVAFLERLRDAGDRFFARVEWHRTKPDVERWRSDAFAAARGIRAADRDPSLRDRNPGHCNMPWSLPCAFRALCLDPNASEIRAQYRVVDDVHTEVREAQTEVPS
jgi:hypothetical protein